MVSFLAVSAASTLRGAALNYTLKNDEVSSLQNKINRSFFIYDL